MADKHLGRVSAYAERELSKAYKREGLTGAHAVFSEMVGSILKTKRMSSSDRLSQIRCFYSALQTVTDK
ncbi:MAG: hypothetical protein ACI4EA_10190 [Candidatus Ornithomonoglobus sp.]